MIDLNKLGAKAAELKDMTKATAGGDYTPPPEGPTKLRFVGYVEQGKHEVKSMGKTKVEDRVSLYFELSGGKDGAHNPVVSEGGKVTPHVVEINLNKSLNEKANFYKLFTRMNYAGKATHMVQLLGEAYIGRLYHREYSANGATKVALNLANKEDGISIRPPRVEDVETGEVRMVSVDKPVSPIRVFVWDIADKEQWDTLFIDGQYEERKDESGKVIAPAASKNKLQLKIAKALNLKGSPAEQLVTGLKVDLDVADTEDTEEVVVPVVAVKSAEDALNDIV